MKTALKIGEDYPDIKDYERCLLKKHIKKKKNKERNKNKNKKLYLVGGKVYKVNKHEKEILDNKKLATSCPKEPSCKSNNEKIKNAWKDTYSICNVLCDEKISPKQRKDLLTHVCKKKQIKGICDIIKDICYNRDVAFNDAELKQIKTDRHFIKKLTDPKISIEEKREALTDTRRGGSIFKLLLPLGAQIAAPFLKTLFKTLPILHL